MDFLSKAFFWKFAKFGIVGFSGVIVDFGITYICKEKFRIQKYVSNALGFCIAATSNYCLNRIWTFNSHDPQIGLEFIKFFGVSIVGLGLNTLILWLLTSKAKWNFYFSKLCAIGVVTIWNFIINSLFTFPSL